MGKILRLALALLGVLVSIAFLKPFSAMLFEPFWSGLLQSLGIDSAEWAAPVVSAINAVIEAEWFQLTGVGIIGMAIGVWAHWAATRFDRWRAESPSGKLSPPSTESDYRPWEQVHPDIKRLLYHMAELSHELVMHEYVSDYVQKSFDFDRAKQLVARVNEYAKFIYFNKNARLFLMGYIVACEQTIEATRLAESLLAVHGKETRITDSAGRTFLEDAPAKYATFLGISLPQSGLIEPPSPSEPGSETPP